MSHPGMYNALRRDEPRLVAERRARDEAEDAAAVEEVHRRDCRDRAIRHVTAQLRRIRGPYDEQTDTIPVRGALAAEDDAPHQRSMRSFVEMIVDYSIRPED